jgi:hypothetical protein
MPPSGGSDGGQQQACCELLASRLGGNGAHPDLLTFVSSNYALAPASETALKSCPAFAALQTLEVAPVEGAERCRLATALLRHALEHAMAVGGGSGCVRPGHVQIDLALSLGSGDVRPLVRHLRCLGAYAAEALRAAPGWATGDGRGAAALRISHVNGSPTKSLEEAERLTISVVCCNSPIGTALEVFRSPDGLLAPSDGRNIHPRTARLVDQMLAGRSQEGAMVEAVPSRLHDGLKLVLDLFLCDAVAPAVVVCTDTPQAGAQADALLHAFELEARGGSGGKTGMGVGIIRHVDVRHVKMNRSLYDRKEERSLRDEILDLKMMASDRCAVPGEEQRVVIELLAPDRECELQIREMVEDSPSLVAHSVHKRILHKTGLLFIVRVGATEAAGVTPELCSRASVVL